MAIFSIIAVIILTILIIWLIDKYNPKKFKIAILTGLWAIIIVLFYMSFMSIYIVKQFNQEKEKRYKIVIENLKDIRSSQLAHKTVTGKYQNNWDSLVNFIENEKFTITQRRDSTIIDKVLTKRYGVDTPKDIVIIDTLGFVPVLDSLFGIDKRYKTMMNVPVFSETSSGKIQRQKFKLETGYITENEINIPVFEVSLDKEIILDGLDEELIIREKMVKSVEEVDGPALKVGSMDKSNDKGNWPTNY